MASRLGQQGARVGELESMSIEQLKAVKEQTDMEVNLLQDSLTSIRTATARLDIASSSIHDLSLRPQGKRMLVPLTASLYVPGTLDDSDKVLIDVGTGYFVEVLVLPYVVAIALDLYAYVDLSVYLFQKTMSEGRDYCERKMSLLKSNYEQLLEVCC